MKEITFKIDGKVIKAKEGQTILEAAKENGVYIPWLCYFEGVKPAGSCRVCTVKVNGMAQAACTTPATEGAEVDNSSPELEDMRKALIEMLFVEGNHFCPACEKSGNCELQALGYRYQMMVPRFPYLWQMREIDATAPKIYLERNRCVQCFRCVNGITTPDGKKIFGMIHRGERDVVTIDPELAAKMTDEEALKAMNLCPVGAIIKKEVGFKIPVGKRKYDTQPIGSDVQK